MKVLIVMDTLGAGGSEKSMALFADYLHTQKIEFAFACLNKVDVGVQEEVLQKGYKVYWLDGKSIIKQIAALLRLIRQEKYDLVHSVLLRSNLRIRVCRMVHQFLHIESLVNSSYSSARLQDKKANQLGIKFYYWLDRLTVHAGTDHFHSVNEAVKQHYIQHLKLKAKDISVVYRGRQQPEITGTTQRSDLGLHQEDFVIVNTGRHEFQKDQLSLLKAMRVLKDKGLLNIKLLILGREGTSTPAMKEFIKEHALEQQIILAGYRTDVPQILPLANVFALSSLYEGTAGALIEAQAAGLPMICNELEELKEIVQEGENCLFFKNENTDSIVSSILFFYKHAEQCKAFASASLLNYQQKFTLEQSNRNMLLFYRKLLATS